MIRASVASASCLVIILTVTSTVISFISRCRCSVTLCYAYDEAGNVIETHEHAGDFREFELRTTHA